MEEKHLKIVQQILEDLKVTDWVYGLRVKNKAHTFSDLDQCIIENYEKSIITKLKYAFVESDLPFKVDVLVWSDLSNAFKKHIEKELVKFNEIF